MPHPKGHLFYIDSYLGKNSSNIFSSETTGPIKAKFHMAPQWIGGTEAYSPQVGHMTQMAAMPMYGKNPLKIFFSGTIGPMVLGLVCCIWDMGPVKFKKL